MEMWGRCQSRCSKFKVTEITMAPVQWERSIGLAIRELRIIDEEEEEIDRRLHLVGDFLESLKNLWFCF